MPAVFGNEKNAAPHLISDHKLTGFNYCSLTIGIF